MANAYAPTYSSLITEIQDICEDTNAQFVGRIPNFIQRAQDQVTRDLGLELFKTFYADNLVAQMYALQPAWLVLKAIWLTPSNTPLDKRSADYVRMYGGATGTPKVWANDNVNLSNPLATNIVVAPTPATSTPVLFDIVARLPPLIVSVNESNWITQNAGDLLLLQSLVNAHEYLINPERRDAIMQMYGAVMQTAAAELRDMERRNYTPLRSAARPG